MLCELSKRFPKHAAKFLERDKCLTRNFREESVTDQLMAALVPFVAEGITVDYPDEVKTGGDMEWIFAAPQEVGGCKYFRLIIQAKRAQYAKRVTPAKSYYYYQHLDHGTPPGTQAQTLMSHSTSTSGATATFPIYAFYHPSSALKAAEAGLPAIEGVNIVFGDLVHAVVKTGCKIKDKKVERWRPHFMTLHDFLCWPTIKRRDRAPFRRTASFVVRDEFETRTLLGFRSFHPDLVAAAVNERLSGGQAKTTDGLRPTASKDIPAHIRRAIDGELTAQDRRLMPRPRVVFRTQITSEDPEFDEARDLIMQRWAPKAQGS